jgi:hypothetical protein
LLAAGPLAWDLLVESGAAALVARRGIPRRHERARVAGMAVVVALLVATTGLAQWQGPLSISASLGSWLDSWSPAAPAGFEAWPPSGLPLFALGLGGLLFASAGLRRYRLPIAVAAGWGLIGLLRPAPLAHAGLVFSLPWSIAAAAAVGAALERAAALRPTARRAAHALAGASGLALLLTSAAAVARSGSAHPDAAAGPRLLVADLEVLLAPRSGPGSQRSIEVVCEPWPDPVLGWYLGHLDGVRWVRAPSSAARAERERLVLRRVGGEAHLLAPDDRLLGRYQLAWTPHHPSAAAAELPASASLRSVGLRSLGTNGGEKSRLVEAAR